MQSIAIEPIALSVSDAARIVPVSRRTLYAEIQAGRLAARRFGRKLLIARHDLMTWFESQPLCQGSSFSEE